MDELPAISAAKLKALPHERVDEFAESVVSSVHAAKPGRWIADSEEPVRETIHELGRAVFEAVIQEKIAAAEAAFPPSGGQNDGSEKT